MERLRLTRRGSEESMMEQSAISDCGEFDDDDGDDDCDDESRFAEKGRE